MPEQFLLQSEYQPAGDQPAAIDALVKGIQEGHLHYQTLQGVTGSGKTFTMANIIQRLQMPTLVISHNKTLAAQLYSELKAFFPQNAVEYFVSYYDYYQPEAYIPATDTYIAKDSAINDELERLRLAATGSLIERKDVIVVASVSCIYGMGDPEEFASMEQQILIDQSISRDDSSENSSHYNIREMTWRQNADSSGQWGIRWRSISHIAKTTWKYSSGEIQSTA